MTGKKVEAEVLPSLDNTRFQEKLFTPITVDEDDMNTTVQDREILNGAMEMTLQAYGSTRTLLGLIALNKSIMELVQARRGVKKLPYGAAKASPRKGRTIEVLD